MSYVVGRCQPTTFGVLWLSYSNKSRISRPLPVSLGQVAVSPYDQPQDTVALSPLPEHREVVDKPPDARVVYTPVGLLVARYRESTTTPPNSVPLKKS